jgi:hypothetical protein
MGIGVTTGRIVAMLGRQFNEAEAVYSGGLMIFG